MGDSLIMSNSDSDKKRERFGRYLILDHLVDGGMAKICRARFLGEQADKVVAIKMVQPQFSKDESFKNMFMDEIKVTFGLLHPNIVQTYDYGMHNDQLFVAMEYCDGRNLKEYLDRLKEKKYIFPVEISIYIISLVSQGLHYAHTYTDSLTGKPANIIHRDISPHNIMLTYSGAVKVIDFGIAKTDVNEGKTQVGTIKGKLSYLAPEYIEGHELDSRYDQFAVGITLWELLCSRRLFKGKGDLAVLKKIQECKIPKPSSFNPNIKPELDEIVLKALSCDRTKRYENMDQLNRALIKFLYANYPNFNASDLSYFATSLFEEEIKKDKKTLFKFGKIDITPYIEDMKNDFNGEGGGSERREISDGSVLDGKDIDGRTITKSVEHVFTFTDDNLTLDKGFARAKGSFVGERGNKDITNSYKTKTAKLSIEQDQQQIGIDNVKDSVSGKKRGTRKRIKKVEETSTFSANKMVMLLFIMIVTALFKSQYLKIEKYMCELGVLSCSPQVTQIEEKKKEKIKITKRIIGSDGKNYIYLKGYNKRTMALFLNGKKKKVDILNRIKIPSDKPSVIRVESIGKKHFVTEIDPTSQDKKNFNIVIPKQRAASYGYLINDYSCKLKGELTFELYGEKRTERIPTYKKAGIAFPLRGDGRTVASKGGAIYTIYFKEKGSDITKKYHLQFKKGQTEGVSLCDLKIIFE